MFSRFISLFALIFFFSGTVFAVPPLTFSGSGALTDTRKAVSYGERPAGSQQLAKLRNWIIAEMKPLGGQITLDPFQGATPNGPVAMTNIIVKFPGTSGKAVVVTGHYDTKQIPMMNFVGANDAGSSTGFLIEFARVASKMKHPDDIYIVFFDGEEAVGEWSATDSLYGSRHLAAKWGTDGTLRRIKALINIDMVGDKDLEILNDGNSSQDLRTLIWGVAARLGDGQYFLQSPSGVDDDHMPFVNAGVNAVDIIDLNYGPNNAYWHTGQDTMDKLSAHSLQVVGDVIVGAVRQLEQQ